MKLYMEWDIDFKFVNLLKFGIFLIFVNYDGVLVCDVYYVL